MGGNDGVQVEPLEHTGTQFVIEVWPVGEDVEDETGLMLVSSRYCAGLELGVEAGRHSLNHTN